MCPCQLASGTLPDPNWLEKQLDIKLEIKYDSPFVGDNVENLFAGILTKGPNNIKFNLDYKNTNDNNRISNMRS